MSATTVRTRKSSRKAVSLPAWYTPVAAFLRKLHLAPIELAEVCGHLDRTRSASGVPILSREDADFLGLIIQCNGKPLPEPEPFPADDGSLTPCPVDTYHPSEADWQEYAAWSQSQSQTVKPIVPACRSRVVANWTDYDQQRAFGCV